MAVAKGASQDADHPADQGEQDGLGQKLDANVALGGAECPAQPDLGSAFERLLLRSSHGKTQPFVVSES